MQQIRQIHRTPESHHHILGKHAARLFPADAGSDQPLIQFQARFVMPPNLFTQFFSIEFRIEKRRLPVILRLTPQDGRRIKLHIDLGIPPGNFIVAPGTVTVPLPANEKRAMNAECENHMLKRTRVPIRNQVGEKAHIPLIHLAFQLPERNAGGIDDGRFRAEMIDEADPSLSVENLHVVGGRYIQMFHILILYLAFCSS